VQKGIVITIDGTAGSGKSTTAREVAKRLGYLYLDTGAMYRAVTLKVLREKVEPDDTEELARLVNGVKIRVDKENRVWLDNEDVRSQIRMPEIDRLVSRISAVPAVRQRLVALQREIGRDGGLVCEGRDIGTVVFPEAELKIYMDAELSERGRRRRRQLSEEEVRLSEKKVIENIATRDEIDRRRSHSPLRIPEDAIIIDTTHLTIEEEIEMVLREVHRLKL
jgi:cytidylate kinase